MTTPGRERKPTPLAQLGGVSGLVYASAPSVAFAVANSTAGLHVAVAVAVGAGAGIALWQLLRGKPVQPALSGLLGVGIAAFIAYQTGSARDYFLVGIWSSLVLAVVFFASVFLRRPLVGVIWAALGGRDRRWRADRRSLVAFDLATLALATVFAARFVVQNWLYGADETGWLAIARIAMGYPLTAAALVVVIWATRRAGRRLDPPGESPVDPAQSPTTAGRRPLG